jgi:hypothetical protein
VEVLIAYLASVVLSFVVGSLACIVDHRYNKVVFKKRELLYLTGFCCLPVLNGAVMGSAVFFMYKEWRRNGKTKAP